MKIMSSGDISRILQISPKLRNIDESSEILRVQNFHISCQHLNSTWAQVHGSICGPGEVCVFDVSEESQTGDVIP